VSTYERGVVTGGEHSWHMGQIFEAIYPPTSYSILHLP